MGLPMMIPNPRSKSGSESESLLFATISMIGHPVVVHVTDGSSYHGIFHTASLDQGYSVILKKARKVGKGKGGDSFAVGSFVDTLVVSSNDLVQIFVKDFLLPAEGVEAGFNVGGSPMRILDNNAIKVLNEDAKVDEGKNVMKLLQNSLQNKQKDEAMRPNGEKVEEPSLAPIVSVHDRQIGADMPQRETNSCNYFDEVSDTKEIVHGGHYLSHNYVCPPQDDSVDNTRDGITSKNSSNKTRCGHAASHATPQNYTESVAATSTNSPSPDSQPPTVSGSSSVLDSKASSFPTLSTSSYVPLQKKNSSCDTIAKEFKLNPGAKVFSPSSVNSRSAPSSLPTIASTGYVPSIPPVVPIAATQSGLDICSFTSRSSLPAKLVQYNSLVTGHNGIPAQYSRPITGHGATPVRFSGQYHPVQAGPAYMHPTPQTQVMVGRMGQQLVYVHPITPDAIQGAQVFSQGSPYPPPLNSCQANMPKLQGAAPQSLQLCTTPPLVTGVPPPFAMPSQMPFSQSFQTIRPIPVPGGFAYFGSKLH